MAKKVATVAVNAISIGVLGIVALFDGGLVLAAISEISAISTGSGIIATSITASFISLP